jgi:hypothetical protein
MKAWHARPADPGAKWGARLTFAAMVILGIGSASPEADSNGDVGHLARVAFNEVTAKSSESDDWLGPASDVLPWKLGDPKLSFKGYEHIIAVASGGAASTALAAKEYAFADYMFVIDGTGVGVYWEEATGSRPTEGILNEVFGLFHAICEGKSSSGQNRRTTNDTFVLRQGYVACQNQDWDSYIAVSVLNFGAVSQVFVTIGLQENREVLDLINSNITDVEIKVFGVQ